MIIKRKDAGGYMMVFLRKQRRAKMAPEFHSTIFRVTCAMQGRLQEFGSPVLNLKWGPKL
jgi:hypothetical protein